MNGLPRVICARPTTWAIGLVLSGLAVSCDSPSVASPPSLISRDDDALFQTDSLGYTLRASPGGFYGEIGVTFTNRSSGTVYIVNCGGITAVQFERRVNAGWQMVWSAVVRACLSEPITVPAGATYRTRVWIFGGYPGSNSYPQFSIPDIAGEYRAVWVNVLSSYQERLPFGDPLPLEQRVSNRFMLATEPRLDDPAP